MRTRVVRVATHLCLAALLLWLALPGVAGAAPLWAEGDWPATRIDAGGGGYTETSGATWLADRPYGPTGGNGDGVGLATALGYVGTRAMQVVEVSHPVLGTSVSRLYQTQRVGLTAYRFNLPNGVYRVTLKLAELHVDAAPGAYAFDVRSQGSLVLRGVEPVAGGLYTAYDRSFTATVVAGTLEVQFVRSGVEVSVAGLEVTPLSVPGVAPAAKTTTATPPAAVATASPATLQVTATYPPATATAAAVATKPFASPAPASPSATASPAPPTPTSSPSATPSQTPSATPSPTASPTASHTAAPSPTETALPSATATDVPASTATPAPSGTATSSMPAAVTATSTPTVAGEAPTATAPASATSTATALPDRRTPTPIAAVTGTPVARVRGTPVSDPSGFYRFSEGTLSVAFWAVDTDSAQDVLDVMLAINQRLEADLGLGVARMETRLFTSRDEYNRALNMTAPAEQVGNIIDAEHIWLLSPGQASEEERQAILKGVQVEMVRVALMQAPGVSVWLRDGLSSYEAELWDEARATYLRGLLAMRRIVGLQALDGPAYNYVGGAVTAHTVVEVMAQTYGMPAVRDLIARLATAPLDAAIQGALGVSRSEFERVWLEYLRTNYGS